MFRRCGTCVDGSVEVFDYPTSTYSRVVTCPECNGHREVYECDEYGCDGSIYWLDNLCIHGRSLEGPEPDYSPSYDDQARDRLRGCDGYDKGDWRRGGV